MDEAARYDGAQPAWITAKRQTGGRGRGGKPWIAPEGNLQATWAGPVDVPLAELPFYSFVAALALFDTLAVWLGKDRLACKWPNDVLADGRKIAGILLESSNGRLNVGVGVNVVAAPPQSALLPGALPAAAMSELMAGPAPVPLRADWVLSHLARDFERWRSQLREGSTSSLLQIWKRRAANLGKPIRVVLPNETVHGIFQDVDDTGQLVLETRDGLRKIAAGDVFFED